MLNRSRTATRAMGALVQMIDKRMLGAGETIFALGISYDTSRTRFDTSTEPGALTEDRSVDGLGSIIVQNDNAIAPVGLIAHTDYWGIFAQDRLPITSRFSAEIALRYNIARVVIQAQIGTALNGRRRFERLARHSIAGGGHVQALADGRWVQSNELRTSEGGIVGIYTDITEVTAEDPATVRWNWRSAIWCCNRRCIICRKACACSTHRAASPPGTRRCSICWACPMTGCRKARPTPHCLTGAGDHMGMADRGCLDLLQPLNAARLFVAALGDRRLALPTRALVNQTSTALDSVEDLLEALLEISDVRLDTLLGTARIEFAPVARAAGLALDMANEPLWVRSDIRLVRRILPNFLSNALRYTQQGSVRVVCAVSAGTIRVSVTDAGSGIPADKQALVFEEFRRFDTRTSGKGLGLAIVKRASDMLGHRVTLDSAPGRGSTFAIELPVGEPVADPDSDPASVGRDRSMRGLNVLVIDNERAVQTGMRTLLGGWGARCRRLAASPRRPAYSRRGIRPTSS